MREMNTTDVYFKDKDGNFRIVEFADGIDICNPRYIKEKIKSGLSIDVASAVLAVVR